MTLTRIRTRRGGEDVWKGAAAGAIGSLVGAWTMNQWQSPRSHYSRDNETSRGAQSIPKGALGNGHPRARQNRRGSDEPGDDATEKLVSAVAERVAGRALTKREKRAGGVAVHYAFGATTEALRRAIRGAN